MSLTPDCSAGPRVRVLAIASGGGHWVQLMRLRPAWAECDAAYATTHSDYEQDVREDKDMHNQSNARFYTFPDANRWQKLRLLHQLVRVLQILARERPDVVITTGASAGFFAVRIAKLLRRRTVWIDSIANAEELSLSGRRAGRYADLWLTQWPHLTHSDRPGRRAPKYFGAVL